MRVSYTTYSDGELLLFLQQGDEKSLEEIYSRYWKQLFSLAIGKLRDFQLAEEIIHDIFVDFWNRRAELDIKGALQYYLASAVKYRVINARIRQNRLNTQLRSLDINEDRLIEGVPSVDYEFNDYLEKLLYSLPEKTQLIFQLSKQQGYAHREIAAGLEISEKTVEYHLSVAMKKLRTRLTNFLFL